MKFRNSSKSNFIPFIFVALFAINCQNSYAQAKVELSVQKMSFINGDTCQIFIKGTNVGDRQITMGIDFRINAKNGDFIKSSTRVFELRKGKELVSSIYADNEKCEDIGSLSIQDASPCTVEGSIIGNSQLCLKVIYPQKGLIPIKN
jgi:hypothetical protein